MSKENKSLLELYMDIQKDLPVIPMNGNNKYKNYKYVLLGDILKVLIPIAHKHGCVVFQTIEGTSINTYLLRPADGEKLQLCTFPLDFSQDIQHVGAQLTYGRRYSLSIALGILADEDIDADLNPDRDKTKEEAKAAHKRGRPPKQKDQEPKAPEDDSAPLNKAIGVEILKIGESKEVSEKVTRGMIDWYCNENGRTIGSGKKIIRHFDEILGLFLQMSDKEDES